MFVIFSFLPPPAAARLLPLFLPTFSLWEKTFPVQYRIFSASFTFFPPSIRRGSRDPSSFIASIQRRWKPSLVRDRDKHRTSLPSFPFFWKVTLEEQRSLPSRGRRVKIFCQRRDVGPSLFFFFQGRLQGPDRFPFSPCRPLRRKSSPLFFSPPFFLSPRGRI